MKLVIGNKNYSSWSMRAWVLLRQAGIPFEEIPLKFDDDSRVRGVQAYSPTKRVPVLLVDGAPVWDSLAICETAAEMFPAKRLWPAEQRARALARSICAEMHSGFHALRTAMPMNIRAAHPGKGMAEGVQGDIDRILAVWDDCRARFGSTGAMLFGHFTVADAYYAPVVTRFITYGVPLPAAAREYVEAVCELPGVAAWMSAARQETEFVAADEPYTTVSGKR
ncbi:MAG TPA: glutathione S-transferase family protein [Burkholderiales bacterium]|nr:glutathione S-transferase family protein [Burkholderiales bacterium]